MCFAPAGKPKLGLLTLIQTTGHSPKWLAKCTHPRAPASPNKKESIPIAQLGKVIIAPSRFCTTLITCQAEISNYDKEALIVQLIIYPKKQLRFRPSSAGTGLLKKKKLLLENRYHAQLRQKRLVKMLRKNTHTSRSSKQASLGRKRLNNVKSTCKYNRGFWQFTQWGSNRDWTVHDLRPTYGSSLASHLTTDPRGRQS